MPSELGCELGHRHAVAGARRDGAVAAGAHVRAAGLVRLHVADLDVTEGAVPEPRTRCGHQASRAQASNATTQSTAAVTKT